MLLIQRAPSLNWEPIPLDQSGHYLAWAWFRPATLPNGLMIVLPGAVFVEPRIAATLTIRQLVAATGLAVTQIQYWSVNGVNFDAAGGTSPMLDQLFPPPPPEGQLQLSVWMEMPQQAGWYEAPMPMAVSAGPVANQTVMQVVAASPHDEQLFAAIDSCWNAIRQLESKVGTVRKQLDQAMSRLNSLNRDLTPEERRGADNKDAKDWQDARRWLRDSLATLSRFVKEIDMGTTSGAGQRHHFEDIHRQYVAPRIPFAGLEQTVQEFEAHAKILQNVVASAQAGLTRAGRDAEQRANGVLMRIASKSRSARRKE